MGINSRTIRKKILKLYGEDTTVANDDALLISRIWASEGWTSARSLYENLKHVSSPETIRRTRAKLVEEGRLKPSDKTQALRREAFKQVLRSI